MTSIAKHRDHPAEIRRTLQLATPVIIGQVAVFGMSFVDTVMAGRLPEKDLALAGLGTGSALFSACMMLVLGILMAVQPTVAQLDGANRHREAGAQTRQALYIAMALVIPFWLLLNFSSVFLNLIRVDSQIVPVAAGYLKALSWGVPAICGVLLLRFFSEGTGHTRATMLYGIFGAILNVPLNYVLMYGKLGFPQLGTVGCGYATAIVLWLQLALIFNYVLRHRHFHSFELFSHLEAPNWKIIGELLKVGLPIAVFVTVESSMFVGAALLIARLGPLPSAAHLIAINFSALLFMTPLGLSSAITIRVGNAIGRVDYDAARYAGMIGLLMVLVFETVSATFILLFPEWIVLLYTDDARVTSLAASLLIYAAIFQYPDGIHICAGGALRGMKDTRMPMMYAVISFWVIGLPVGYYLTFQREMGPSGMWIGMIVGLTIAAILLSARYFRISQKLIHDSAASDKSDER
jgi:MATE family multidrug resistance protein